MSMVTSKFFKNFFRRPEISKVYFFDYFRANLNVFEYDELN